MVIAAVAVAVVVRIADVVQAVDIAGVRTVTQIVATADAEARTAGAQTLGILAVGIPVARSQAGWALSGPSRSCLASSQKSASVGFQSNRLV